jgi:hypothetical protein
MASRAGGGTGGGRAAAGRGVGKFPSGCAGGSRCSREILTRFPAADVSLPRLTAKSMGPKSRTCVPRRAKLRNTTPSICHSLSLSHIDFRALLFPGPAFRSFRSAKSPPGARPGANGAARSLFFAHTAPPPAFLYVSPSFFRPRPAIAGLNRPLVRLRLPSILSKIRKGREESVQSAIRSGSFELQHRQFVSFFEALLLLPAFPFPRFFSPSPAMRIVLNALLKRNQFFYLLAKAPRCGRKLIFAPHAHLGSRAKPRHLIRPLHTCPDAAGPTSGDRKTVNYVGDIFAGARPRVRRKLLTEADFYLLLRPASVKVAH